MFRREPPLEHRQGYQGRCRPVGARTADNVVERIWLVLPFILSQFPLCAARVSALSILTNMAMM